MKRNLLLLALTLFESNVFGYNTKEIDGVSWRYSISTDGVTIGTGSRTSAIPSSTAGAIVIPETIDGRPVTCIDEYAFYGCEKMTSISIPKTIVRVRFAAFEFCSGLTSVHISDLLAWCKIEFNSYFGNPFNFAKNLYCNGKEIKDLVIPNGITSIKPYAFRGCSGITSVTIPDGVTSIGGSAFEGCGGLTSVKISSTVENIYLCAFEGCGGLKAVHITDLSAWCRIMFIDEMANPLSYAGHLYLNGNEVKKLDIPVGISNVGDYAFSGCKELTEIVLTDGVTSIGSYAFSGCSGLTAVTMSDSIASIGKYAFANCNCLTSVAIPAGVKSIERSSFCGCEGLSSITIPHGVTSIDYAAFENCKGLVAVVIPSSVTSIDSMAFNSCGGLRSVTIPASVKRLSQTFPASYSAIQEVEINEGQKEIYDSLFKGCSGLISVKMPNSITTIGDSAFRDCVGLKSVSIPEGVVSIGSSAFYGCKGLTSVIIPSNVKEIYSHAFECCDDLMFVHIVDLSAWCGVYFGDKTANPINSAGHLYLNGVEVKDLVIPNGEKSIGGYAFCGCKGLLSVVVPDSVKSIGSYAFRDCSGLTSVTIPSSVTTIGYEAFCGCSCLDSVKIPSSVTEIVAGTFSGCSSLVSAEIPQGVKSIGDSAFEACSNLTSVTMPRSVTNIGKFAFRECTALTSVEIPDGVFSIGDQAFAGCKTLIQVSMPDSVKNLGVAIFDGCVGLAEDEGFVIVNGVLYDYVGTETSIIIPEKVLRIDAAAFCDRNDLFSVDIPNSVTNIGQGAFSGCGGIVSVAIPNCVSSLSGVFPDAYKTINSVTINVGRTNIGSMFFYGCSGLVSVVIPEGVTSIGADAFHYCDSLRSLTLPNSLKSIGRDAFEGCSGLKSLAIPDSVTSMDMWAFAYCAGLTNVSMSSGLKAIPYAAFTGCRSLSSVIIPNGVTSVGDSAFSGCSGLTSLIIASSVTNIAHNAFGGCGGLASVVIPDGVLSIGDNAFSSCSGLTSMIIPEGVEHVGQYAFRGCSGLVALTLPKSVRSIGGAAFSGCSSLTNMVLPFVGARRGNTGTVDSLFGYVFGTSSYSGAVATKQYYTSADSSDFYVPQTLRTVEITDETIIAYGAFYGCSCLTSILIPSSVVRSYDKAFWGCSGLTTVEIQDLVAWCQIEFETADANPVNIVHSLMMSGNEVDDLEVPSVVKRVGSYAFAGASSLTSVTMHPSVKNVGDGAFEGCTSLTSVRISDLSAWCCIGFDSLNANPLALAHKLLLNGEEVVELVIPEGVPGIGSYSFAGCSALTSVTIPTSVKNIGEKAFYNCSSLMRVLLPWDVNIGADAIPATALIVRPVTVAVKGCEDEYVYDGLGKCYGVELEPSTNQYSVLNVTNTLSVLSANVGVNQIALSAEMFQNTNENYEVTFVVDSVNNTSKVAIVPRPVTVTAGSAQKVYDGSPLVCSDITVGGDGFVEGECVPKAVGSQTSVGSSRNTVCLEWAKGALESSYSIVTNEGTLTVLPAKVADAGVEPGAGTKPVGGISKFDGEPVKYDGKGHTINVAALEAVTLVADTPSFSYSLMSNGVYQSEPYYFTNACVTSFWYKISAANYEDYVHEARVTILPREVTLTSGSASKNFDGTALRCERDEVTGDGFVAGEGVDVVYTGSQLWPGASENTFTYSFKQGTLASNYEVTTANGTLTVGAVGRVVVDTSVTVIPAKAFKNYAELMEVVLPDTVTEIGADAFAGCAKLTKVAFPSGMEVTREKLRGWGLSDAVLDDYAEGDFIIVNTSLLGYVGAADVGELVIPDGIELIDEYALSELDDLERVELPETVKYIGKGAFANDTYLDEVVLPDSVEVIGEGAFENCSWMQTMTMGAGVRSVGDRAFAGCTKLAAAKFVEGLGEVGDAAFSNCWRMMSVSLPVSVSNVAATAFKDCASLTGVTVPTMIAPMSEWFAPVYRQIENVTMPEGTTEVCAEMFAGCAELKTVELPEGVTNIASGAFRDCVALETILLPESLEAIGDEAFAGCAALKAIVLPKNVAVLGKRVFSGCAALSDVTLSRALTAIPDGTFAGCDALDSFVVPEAVTELGSQIVPSATTAIYYLGNAPAYAADVYAQANAALVSYVVDGTKGWDGRPTSRDIPQTWPMSNARTIRTWSPPPPSVTVRFNATGGTVEPEERVYVSEAPFGGLPVPVRTYYDFAGWFTEASGGTQVTAASEVPLADRELFAHWTAKQYAIRFHANDGTERTTDQAFTYGATVTLAKNEFVRTGYTFAGWATSAGGAAVYADGKTLEEVSAIQDGVIHLYAVWTANGYEVRFDANGGEGTMESQQFAYGVEKALTANGFVRTGYAFAGWEQRGAAGVRALPDCASVKNLTDVDGGTVTLYAQWTPNGYTVDFNPGQGGMGAMPDQPMTYDEEAALYSNLFYRTGYTFLGWTDNENEVEEVLYYDGVVVSNLTAEADGEYGLYAIWMANEYMVVFDANGGTGTMEPQGFVYDETQALKGNVFECEGRTFVGWATAEDGGSTVYADGATVKNLTAEADGVVTLYAQWSRSGWRIVPGEKVEWDTGLIGYTVSGLPKGLSYSKTTGKITGSASKPTAAEGAVVKFTKKGFETEELTIVVTAIPKVTVGMEGVNSPGDTDGCKVTGAGAYLVGKKVTLKATVPKGTVFMGWFDDEDVVATQATYSFTMGKENVNLVAKFKKEVMSVGCETLSSKESFPAGVLGAEGGIKLDISTESGVKSVKVDKLPSGMKYDSKSGLITGAPTKAGDNKVIITVTAKSGAVAKTEIEVKVAAMPVMVVGTFSGFVSVGEDNFGTFTLTTTDAGKLTAKVITAAGSVSFSKTCWDAVEKGVYRATLTTKKGEKLALTLDSTAAWDANQLSGEFTTAEIAATKKTAAVPSRTYSVSAQKNAFGKTWYFTAVGDESAGWTLDYAATAKAAALTVTLKADGSTAIAGKLPGLPDKKGKATSFKVSASGYANVGGLKDGAILADFAPVLTVNKIKKILAIRTNLWFDRKNDHGSGVGEAKFVK